MIDETLDLTMIIVHYQCWKRESRRISEQTQLGITLWELTNRPRNRRWQKVNQPYDPAACWDNADAFIAAVREVAAIETEMDWTEQRCNLVCHFAASLYFWYVCEHIYEYIASYIAFMRNLISKFRGPMGSQFETRLESMNNVLSCWVWQEAHQ